MKKKLITIFDKLKKAAAPKMIEVNHFIVHFKTTDGEEHSYSGLKYFDTAAVNCGFLDYYLIGKDFLKDDQGCRYPMQNVVKVWAEIDNSKLVEEKMDAAFGYKDVWYEV